MSLENRVREILEGGGGAVGSATRLLLSPAAALYGAAALTRSEAYRRGIFSSLAAGAPVISVGNLAAGGVGKTPLAADLCRRLIAAGRRPGILLRGYGAADPSSADETLLYARLVPQTKTYADPDRVAAAVRATGEGCDVLVLDDGFQHLRLRRDLDLVLLDAARPFGGGWPLPAGILREFPRALARADAFCLTRCNEAGDAAADRTAALLAGRFPDKPVIRCNHSPRGLFWLRDGTPTEASLTGRRVFAAAGIGKPDSFVAALERLGAHIVGRRFFGDHHPYSEPELLRLATEAARLDAVPVFPEKDAVRIPGRLAELLPPETLTLRVEIVYAVGEELLDRLLSQVLASTFET